MKYLLFVLITNSAWGLDLQGFLNQVESSSQSLQSAELKKQSAQEKRTAGDIELSPILSLDYGYLNDQKPTALPAFLGDKTVANSYSASLGKKFSTGTQVQLGLSGVSTKIDGTTPPQEETSAGALSVAMSQSLWKDGFGKGTRLRQDRESYIEKMQSLSGELLRRSTLIAAEQAYWDYLIRKEELVVRRSSLERAKKLESWMARRVRDGIGDSSDSTQAKSLLELRDLELLDSEDELMAAKKKLAEVLSLADYTKVPEMEGNVSSVRGIPQMIGGADSSAIIRIDAKIAEADAKMKQTISHEVENALAPELNLAAKYSTNSQEDTLSEAVSQSSETDRPTYSVGLHFMWIIDGDYKNASKQSARHDSQSSELDWKQKRIESDHSWTELNRRHLELTKKIDSATRIAQLRKTIAKDEESKLSRGRTITSNVINAAQDADEAELTLIKLKSEQRKLEAQARMFMVNE